MAGDDVLAVVNEDFTERIRKTFLDALYSFLDGLVHLAFSDGERTRTDENPTSSTSTSTEPRKQRNIDFAQLDPRILVTISNLNEVGSKTIPKLLADFERTCRLSMAEDGKVRLCATKQGSTIESTQYLTTSVLALSSKTI